MLLPKFFKTDIHINSKNLNTSKFQRACHQNTATNKNAIYVKSDYFPYKRTSVKTNKSLPHCYQAQYAFLKYSIIQEIDEEHH